LNVPERDALCYTSLRLLWPKIGLKEAFRPEIQLITSCTYGETVAFSRFLVIPGKNFLFLGK